MLRMKNFNVEEVHKIIQVLEGESRKTNMDRGLPKKGAWTVCLFKGESLATKRG